MHRAMSIAGRIAAIIVVFATTASAHAGHGAIAYDQNTGKQGSSWDQATQTRASELALKQCGSAQCQVHPVEPAGCGALAISNKDKAWGGADRETLDAAKRDAIAHCQSHTTAGKCTARVSGCNK